MTISSNVILFFGGVVVALAAMISTVVVATPAVTGTPAPRPLPVITQEVTHG